MSTKIARKAKGTRERKGTRKRSEVSVKDYVTKSVTRGIRLFPLSFSLFKLVLEFLCRKKPRFSKQRKLESTPSNIYSCAVPIDSTLFKLTHDNFFSDQQDQLQKRDKTRQFRPQINNFLTIFSLPSTLPIKKWHVNGRARERRGRQRKDTRARARCVLKRSTKSRVSTGTFSVPSEYFNQLYFIYRVYSFFEKI
jgi:hypothetical protein